MASAAGPPPVDAAAAQRLIDYATLPNETPLQRMIRIGSQQQTAITIFIRDIEELTKQIDKTNDKYSEAENALMEKVASLEKHEEKEIGSAASARSTHDRESEKLNRQIIVQPNCRVRTFIQEMTGKPDWSRRSRFFTGPY